MSQQKRARRLATRLVLTGLAAGLALTGLAAAPALAETGDDGGWVRLTHLSPDTPEVNVELTSLADSEAVLELEEVGYGAVSDYVRVEPGTYVATMIPPGGDSGAAPAISQSVTVEDGRAYTVAAVGLNADLTGTVLDDDLETPADGSAKIRLLQASNLAPTVDVSADGGLSLAEGAQFGTATGYAEVESGVWAVTVTPTEGEAEQVTTDVTAESGTVNTVIVLDDEDGEGVTTLVINDAAAVADTPSEGTGVPTGLGGAQAAGPGAVAGLVGGGVLLAAAIVVAVARGRAPQPRRAL